MEKLRKVPFGKTNLEVTNICVGGAALGGMPYGDYRIPEKIAIDTLIHIFNSPIRFLDTASLYGESERRIGKASREFGVLPEDFIIATKADRDPKTGDFSAEQVKRSVDKSQELLGLRQLPIVYLHDPEHSSFSFEQVMSSSGPVAQLQRLKEEGVIRCIGISGGPVEMMGRYIDTGAFDAVITHNRFTILNRSAEPLIDKAVSQGLAVVNAAVYNGGILAKGSDQYPYYAYQAVTVAIIDKIKLLEDICRKYDVTLPAIALQFSLRDSRITSTVIGMSSPEEVDETLVLAGTDIPEDVWNELESFQVDTQDLQTP